MNGSTHRAVVHQVFLGGPASKQDHFRHQNALFLSPPPETLLDRKRRIKNHLAVILPSEANPANVLS
jgi:hypothetical protein